MADNVTADPGSGGAVFATDDVAGVHYPINKIAIGALDSVTLASGGNGATDAGTLRVTLANDSTGVVNLGATDNAVLDSIDTATTSLATTVLAEDAVHSTGAAGIMPLAVRNDGLAPLAGTDGDYAPLQVNRRGALYTADVHDSHDVFGRDTVASQHNDIDVPFFRASDPADLVKVTLANNATATANVGGALFSSSTDANGSVQAVTGQTTKYISGCEIYVVFTAAFTAGIANSYMRVGLYNSAEGFFLGYEGTSWGLTVRNNSVDGAQITAFSDDPLDGSAGSMFTRAGVAEAIDHSKLNVYRIRFGWLGSAPVLWEVLAPDGHWVTFHRILYPNLQATPSIRNADLPVTLDITKTAAAGTNITIQTDCWGAGTTAGPRAGDSDELAFQTTALLNDTQTFDSGILSLSPEFSQVQTSVVSSHVGDITIDWYRDAAGVDLLRTLQIPYSTPTEFQFFAAPAFTPYVRYRFNNDSGSTQTDFYFDTKFLRRALQPQVLRVDGTIADGMVATVNRSLITAYNGTAYTNVQATTSGNLKVSLQELSDGVDVGAGTGGSETQRVIIDTADVNLSAIKTAVELIDNAIAGSEMQVDVVTSALPSGAATETTLATVETNTDFGTVTGGGTETGALRVTLANDSTGVVSVDDGAGSLTVDNSGTFAVQVDAALPAGTNNIGDVDVASIAAGSNLIGDVGISGARTSGGTKIFRSLDLDESEEQITGTTGQIYWIHAMNFASATRFLKIYDATAATVVVGTTTPVLTFPLATQGDTNGAGFWASVPNGIAFSTAITVAATTGVADADTGAPGANEVIVNIGYAD